MKKYLSILFLLLFVGCATVKLQTSQDVIQHTRVDTDNYEKITTITGPEYSIDIGDYVLLRAFIKNNKVTDYHLYVSLMATDWSFFERAYDSEGKELKFVEIDKDVSAGYQSAICYEIFGIMLDREYLEKSLYKGIDIKVAGKRGSKVLFLPPFYIEGYLKKVDSLFGNQPK